MNWLREFDSSIERDAPLGRMTWFRLGGRARCLFRPRDVKELCRFMLRAGQEGASVRVLGRGANVLVRDGCVDGVIVRLDAPEFREVHREGSHVHAGAGVELTWLSRSMSARGMSGLESMAGIPATVGGAVCMNAGGRFGAFGDVVSSIDVLRQDGRCERWDHDRIGFGYRRSGLEGAIVLRAELSLEEDDPVRVRRRYREYFSLKQRTQPLADHSAGCIFKNPGKVSAGALIDRAGMKGMRVGPVVVSDRHANFIVAESGACAGDVLRLIDVVRERVLRVFGVMLALEIDVW